jgi:hypothetical protein
MIQLLCPNAKCGEKLSCPDNFAGKLGKCPHCGSKFKVPIPKKASAGAGGGAAVADAEAVDDSDILEEDALERIVDSDILDRGHHDDEAEELVDSDVLDPKPERAPPRPQKPPVQNRPTLSIDSLMDEEEPPALMPPGRSGKRAAPPLPQHEVVAPVHPLSVLFAQLWEQKQRGANLELQLADGDKLAPEGFAPSLSQFTHGVFAVKMLDGTHTMMAVAWDKVARVTLRGVRDLPPGLFS